MAHWGRVLEEGLSTVTLTCRQTEIVSETETVVSDDIVEPCTDDEDIELPLEICNAAAAASATPVAT